MFAYNCPGFITTAPWGEFADKLVRLSLKDGMTSIGDYAFMNCFGLKGELIIPDSVTTIGKYAFNGCGFLGELNIHGMKSIGYAAFQSCGHFTSVVISDSVYRIESYAFNNCYGLKKAEVKSMNVILGAKVFAQTHADFIIHCYEGSTAESYATANEHTFVLIDDRAVTVSGMCGDNLTWTLYNDGELVVSGTGDMWNYTSEYSESLGKYITSAPWGEYITQLAKLTIEEGVNSIGEHAFRDCIGFKGDLVFPESVTNIGKSAFMYCSGFTGDLIIPNSVNIIDKNAFQDCPGFNGSLIIGESLTRIDNFAFWGCPYFTDVKVYSKNVNLCQNVFDTGLIIHGYEESTAQTYAAQNNHKFVILKNRGTIIGHLMSCNPKVATKIELFENGYVKYTFEIAASNYSGIVDTHFELADIEYGTYDLVITKSCHLSYTVKNIVVEGDLTDLTIHSNEEISTIRLVPGDINGDGCVDLKDVVELTSDLVYGRVFSEVTKKSADVNGDACFDLKDLIIITSELNYGKSAKVVAY